jgi:hypothetical protein
MRRKFHVLALRGQRASNGPLLPGPHIEWELEYKEHKGNKFDVVAKATFTHTTGEMRESLMFYSGQGNIWKFRFTGTRIGEWTIETSGPGSLGGYKGKVIIKENPGPNVHGFLKAIGDKWGWQGTGEAFVPQLVMAKSSEDCWDDENERVRTEKIDNDIHVFVHEHGFTGLHLPEGRGRWFDIHSGRTMEYKEIDIGTLDPADQLWEVPYKSDWAIAIGNFVEQ